jgi:hypothetical protein
LVEHTPIAHTRPWPHVTPHPPQLALSALVFAQYGAPPSPPHFV